ncbi:unnamed protein product [Triticum turgidum subsp. durum]|uniref:Fatty acyl-CoA reductase n=1 Tax=Triticum turgidum subsp. durum TaxID=4567 RepID=A0A9R0ZDP6_TRITD|nr:unnamed protein product [Triticum turgidum subsp. durum]
MVMVDGSLDAEKIAGYFKGKSILITGATGFLGKILVEKILRVQPDVRRIYLLVRAMDAHSAKQRVEAEVLAKLTHSNTSCDPGVAYATSSSTWTLMNSRILRPELLRRVTDTELFCLLKEKHGKGGFELFVEEKVVPLAGDVVFENMGLDAPRLEELANEVDIIVNGAATTNFYERYDVALDVNVMGVKYLCQFAKKCANLKMLLHVSTAFAAGDREGLIMERPFKKGETLREGTYLDIDAELRLAGDVKKELERQDGGGGGDKTKRERKGMKELGLERSRHFGWSNTYVFTKAMGEMLLGQLHGAIPVVILRPSIITSILRDPLPGWMQGTRTIDTIIIGYAKQNLSCFLADLELTMDVIPGDMVANAMMVAMVAHSEEQGAEVMYHATSSLRNPAPYGVLYESGRRHFYENPRLSKDGRVIPTKEMHFFKTIASFHLYMLIKYKLPLEILHVVNLLLCGLLSQLYDDLNRKYKFVMHLVDVYGPFALFKGCFDDINLERLRLTMTKTSPEDDMFNFDPKTVDWNDYFYKIHIPGVLKYVLK